MLPQSFDAAIAASHDALRAMAQGDPRPTLALWSRRPDAALANPVAPPFVGYPAIENETVRVAAMFGGLESFAFEEVVRGPTPDLGYLLGFERARVKRAGSDSLTSNDLRVTTVFRREDDGWRLVLRFADRNGIDGKRPDRSNVTNLFSLDGAEETLPTPDFNAAVAANRQAQQRVNQRAMAEAGDGPRRMSIWSRRDEVALANPLGPPVVGIANIMLEASAVIASIADASLAIEEMTRVVTPELGFILNREHGWVKRSGSDATTPLDLRVATILRREENGWKRVLRHADRMPT